MLNATSSGQRTIAKIYEVTLMISMPRPFEINVLWNCRHHQSVVAKSLESILYGMALRSITMKLVLDRELSIRLGVLKTALKNWTLDGCIRRKIDEQLKVCFQGLSWVKILVRVNGSKITSQGKDWTAGPNFFKFLELKCIWNEILPLFLSFHSKELLKVPSELFY